MEYQVIGFSRKFFTLWNVVEEKVTIQNGLYKIIKHYNYVKNISYDKDKAFAAYPNAAYDEDLRGRTKSWKTVKEVWENVDTFRFGKYKYQKINDNDDIDYIAWYWEHVDGEHRDYISKILKLYGYEIGTWYTKIGKAKYEHQYLVSPETVAKNKAKVRRINMIENSLKNNDPLEVNIDRNPDSEGFFMEEDGIKYHFQEVDVNYYNGFHYYLPKLNGKQKRIKNKTILITDYTINRDDNDATIEIFNFMIKK